MLNSLRKSLLAGVGVVSFTKDKLSSLFDDLVERGEISNDQAKKILSSLLRRGETDKHHWVDRVVGEVDKVLSKAPLVTRAEYRTLEARVRALEGEDATTLDETVEAKADETSLAEAAADD